MKPNSSFLRYQLLIVVIFLYLIPISCLVAYNSHMINPKENWPLFSFGLFFSFFGAFVIFFVMTKWESIFQERFNSQHVYKEQLVKDKSIESISEEESFDYEFIKKKLEESQQTNTILEGEIETLVREIEQLSIEKKQHLGCAEVSLAESEEYKKNASNQLEQQQGHIRKLQETIANQKNLIEKKQQQIGVLETKVNDLRYEIKTLLQLAEAHSGSFISETSENYQTSLLPNANVDMSTEGIYGGHLEKQIHTSEEASLQLKRCLDIAQKITGSHRFNSHLNSFMDAPTDSYTLDLRRLCDSLRSENVSPILLYSPKENQLLFANNKIKILTGWSPDKFVQNFNEILLDEKKWKLGVSSLAMRSEAFVELPLKTKTGQESILNGQLGMIPTGIFRNYMIAVLYQPL